MTKEHTSEEIKYRLSDLGVQIGNIAIEYISKLEKQNKELQEDLGHKKIAIKTRKARIKDLEEQIEKMKSDVRELITDRMNDDLDQNIIERLFEKWE